MHDTGPKVWLIRSRNSPYWVIRYEDPETSRVLQKSTGADRKKEAERILGEFRSDLVSGRYQGPNTTSWTVFREKYEAEVLSGLARRTVQKVDSVMDAVERIIGPKMLSDVTAGRLSKFAAELRDGTRSESTIAGYMAHLRAALNWAVGVGLLHTLPKIQRPRRAKVFKKPKGRAPTEVEFQIVLAAVPEIVGDERAGSWQHLIRGLWWSGLRLTESLDLWWDKQDRLCIEGQGGQAVLRIPAELEKGHQDRLLPIAPEFAEFLAQTPPDQRAGRVFHPMAERRGGTDLQPHRVSEVISMIGQEAGVVVHVETRTGKKKFVSAHDFRRAFGDRWALRVMPPILMQLMRHESIETTMRFYVGRSIQETTNVLWQAYEKACPKVKENGLGHGQRDTLRDTSDGLAGKGKEPPDASAMSAGS